MTVLADRLRTKRQHFAAPGGFHDLLVRVLGVGLPALIGALLAYLVIAPLSPRGEVSFLLDRNRVEISPMRVQVVDAMYRGDDSKGRPFSINAGRASQKSAQMPLIEMQKLSARIALGEGPAQITADAASYDYRAERVTVRGPLRFSASDGYRLSTSNVAIDLKDQRITSASRVEGKLPEGSFSADRIIADLDERRVVLDGHARLRMVPGALRN